MKKILVVDDEQDIAGAIAIRLKSSGYEVITASDGMEGLQKARIENPDLILLDVMLPKLDGYKVCRMLKFDERYKRIPIIMVTGKFSDEDKRKGLEVGADHYILKPFDHKELLSAMDSILAKREG